MEVGTRLIVNIRKCVAEWVKDQSKGGEEEKSQEMIDDTQDGSD